MNTEIRTIKLIEGGLVREYAIVLVFTNGKLVEKSQPIMVGIEVVV